MSIHENQQERGFEKQMERTQYNNYTSKMKPNL